MSRAIWAVMPAAGVGRRLGAPVPKQYLPLAGRTVIEHSLEVLLADPRIGGVAIAIGTEDAWWNRVRPASDKPLIEAAGGAERCHSVLNALQALKGLAAAEDWVLVHDAVRPCLPASDLDTLIETLNEDAVGGLLAAPVCDTMKRADATARVAATIDRNGLWRALTPQMFRFGLLVSALTTALEQDRFVTDEAAAVEMAGFAPRLVEGRADNIKITRVEDLALAEFYLGRRG